MARVARTRTYRLPCGRFVRVETAKLGWPLVEPMG